MTTPQSDDKLRLREAAETLMKLSEERRVNAKAISSPDELYKIEEEEALRAYEAEERMNRRRYDSSNEDYHPRSEPSDMEDY